MRTPAPYCLLLWVVSLIAATTNAVAEDMAPKNWQLFQPQFLELKPGYKLYQPDGGLRVLVDTPDKPHYFHVDTNDYETNRWHMANAVRLTSACFAEIRTVEQARELCELLLSGGTLVEDAATYQKLLKVHRDFGLKQLVEDHELVFKPVAQAVEGGFQIEFTAFYEPDTMGAKSVFARFEFLVAKDATFKIKSSKNYVEGMYLNWQTGLLDTAEKKEREARQLGRVFDFSKECGKASTTLLPRMPEEKK